MFSFLKKFKEKNSKIEYLERQNLELTMKVLMLESFNKRLLTTIRETKNSKENRDSKIKKVVEYNNKNFFYCPDELSLVDEIYEENNKFCFSIVISGKEKILKFSALDECNLIRNLILNIDSVPSEKESEQKRKITRTFEKSIKKRVDDINKNSKQKDSIDLEKLNGEIKNVKK